MTVDLSEGKAYLTDWVLIEEKKDGGMMRKKKQAAATAAQSAAAGGASSSGASAPSVAEKAPTPAPETGRRASAKSKVTATATPLSKTEQNPLEKAPQLSSRFFMCDGRASARASVSCSCRYCVVCLFVRKLRWSD